MLSEKTVILYCIYFIEFSLSDMLCLYRDAAGLWWYGKYAAVMEAFANLILNLVLGRLFGIDGILVATIMTFGAFTIGYYGFIIFKRYFGIERIGRCIFDNFIYLIVICLASVLTLRCCRIVGEFGISTLIVRGIVCLFIPNMIFILCFCRYRYFRDAMKFIQSMIKIG